MVSDVAADGTKSPQKIVQRMSTARAAAPAAAKRPSTWTFRQARERMPAAAGGKSVPIKKAQHQKGTIATMTPGLAQAGRLVSSARLARRTPPRR